MNNTLTGHLNPVDQKLFEVFGRGDDVELPFTLIHRAIEAQVAQRPDAIAARHLGETLTYAELNSQANALAWTLLQHGVRPGDNVGLFVQRSLPMLVGIVATLKVGAAYVPQDARISPETTLAHVMTAAKTRVVLTLSALRHRIPQVDDGVVLEMDQALALPTADVAVAVDPPEDPVCFVLFTSGTTGMPNGVKVSHKNVCNILLTEPGGLGIEPGMVVAQILNIAFDMAAWEIFGALSKGATLHIRGKDIGEAAAQADVVIATPSILATVDPNRCQGVKVAAVAGEPCPKPLADTWSAFCTFYNSCGPTEVTIVNTMTRCRPDAEGITIGKPNPNTTVYILDQDLKPLPIGEVGEMWAGGDCVTQGYIGNPALTADRYRPDPFLGGGRMMFRTRDLGRWTQQGELEHFGRTDDQVKIRGFRVELDSVSAAVEAVPAVQQAVTLKLDDRNLVLFVTPIDVDTHQAEEAIAAKLPYYCAPAFIEPLASLPRTDRGKVDKRALSALAAQIAERQGGVR